jgi:hypothetical protein
MGEAATVQSILNRFLDVESLDTHRRKICGHLQACRTEALGGLTWRCDTCANEQPRYHACRDRHCPQCQGRATRQWSERQRDHLLPVTYYHLVFTLPHTLNGWVALHPEVIYRLLFQSAWATLKAFGQNPKRLGGELGMTAVLHTWGQNLSQHVHLHCLVPGGALSDAGEWKPARSTYLFPVKALSRRFRGTMVSLLRESATAGELHRVTRPGAVDAVLNALMNETWVVYTKACLSHTPTVVDYLARYSHRIAITNARVLAVDEEGVTLRYKDYRDGDKQKLMHLDGAEFVRRFLLHVLPKGLMRIRHYGFLANRTREAKLARIRQVLAIQATALATGDAGHPPHETGFPCAKCKQGTLRVVGEIMPRRGTDTLPFR